MKRLFLSLLPVLLLAGCSLLPAPDADSIQKYMLEYPAPPATVTEPGGELPVLLVSMPRTHGGYDSRRMAYMQETHGLSYFTKSRWVDTPARMLAPLMADALQASGRFQSFYTGPGAVAADLRLDTELVRFYQDFRKQPSEVRISLRARLVDLDSNRVVASRQFTVTETVATDDAYGGVVAANSAIAALLRELTQFCIESSS